MARLSAEERFWNHVEKTPTCWNWTASLNGGYGRFNPDGRLVYAHRWLYEQVVGPVPAGLDLDHLCRNRACVRPDHLEPVTRYVNVFRGDGTGSFKVKLRTHCKHGHELTEENTYRNPSGRRECKICRRASDIKRYRDRGIMPRQPTTHCPQGHEYTPENTYTDARGSRGCRICRTEAARRHRARRTA